MSTPIRIKRSAVPGKRPTINDLQLGELALNTYDADLFTVRNRSGIGTDIVKIGSGTTVTNILYVTKDGSDTNTGRKLGDAKATIKGAIAAATEGTSIKISAGSYIEDNPIKIPSQVSLVGDTLREVSIIPQNSNADLFHVSPGNYITDMSFTGTLNSGYAIAAFDPNEIKYFAQSPYIRNCTNFIPNSIGLKIDGNHAIGPIKSMVLDSFTQYNQGGIGISITNEGYAQLVSLFTICPDAAVYCGSGGACDLTNSNSSFGNYGLIADGVSSLKYTAAISEFKEVNSDTFTLSIVSPTKVISNVTYNNVTGIATIVTSTPHNLGVGMAVTFRNISFLCPPTPSPNIQTRNVSYADYDNISGIVTITTLQSNHRFSIGMGVSLAGLGFTCPSGPGIVTYPSGSQGYVFQIDDITAANKFTINVGTSTLPHTYLSGGTVDFVGYSFPSGTNGYIFETKTVAPGRYYDSYNLIQANRQEIIDGAYDQIGISYPSFTNPNPDKCKRDLGYIVDAVSKDVRDYTSGNSIQATKSYFNSSGTLLTNGLQGEVPQTITAFQKARDMMKLAITNNLTVKDLSITADPLTGYNLDPTSCSDVRSFIDNLVGIITTRINTGNLNTLPLPSVSMASTVFTVNVGVSTFNHTYTGGGIVKLNVNRPFDGQVVYFNDLYYTVESIAVGSGGTGYTQTPEVTIGEPDVDWGVSASAVANIENGSITSIEIVSSGRGYRAIPTITIGAPNSGINTATAVIKLSPTYYIIKKSTPISSGICTITVSENVPYAVGVGTQVLFYKQSRVLASGHSFEYIGSGTDIKSCLPSFGGVSIQDNEADMRNGGLVVYTSTDQSGNFRIGDGVVVDQQTGTISGKFYSKSLFSVMTPFILALGGE